MDSHYLQQQRFQLQKRARRLASCGPSMFHDALVRFWNYAWNQPLLAGALFKLKSEAPAHDEHLSDINRMSRVPAFADEDGYVSFVYRVVEHHASQQDTRGDDKELALARRLSRAETKDAARDFFWETFLEPLYEYLDEALDQQGAVLSLLVKYKRKVEWFEKEAMAQLAGKGERTLAKHLYAYLFDQGLDFHIEPQSASGEPDMVAKDLVLDAKVFDGDSSSRGIRYLKHGVNQVLTYCRDFNQSAGYLAIFRTCKEDLQFDFADSTMPVPTIQLGGKTLYLLVIDICDYADMSASKRGQLKAHVVTALDLREVVPEPLGSMHADAQSSQPVELSGNP